jgi:hypothetical protein
MLQIIAGINCKYKSGINTSKAIHGGKQNITDSDQA